MKTIISSKGQIVLPMDLRRLDKIEAGQELEIERLGPGEYRLVLVAPRPNLGLVDLLLSCPEKDFFVPLDSESTATL